jgi:hypothetical protein
VKRSRNPNGKTALAADEVFAGGGAGLASMCFRSAAKVVEVEVILGFVEVAQLAA